MEIRQSAKQSRSPTPFFGGRRHFLHCLHCFLLVSADVPCTHSVVVCLFVLFCFFNQCTGGAGLSRMDETGSTTANGAVGLCYAASPSPRKEHEPQRNIPYLSGVIGRDALPLSRLSEVCLKKWENSHAAGRSGNDCTSQCGLLY